MTKYDNNQCIAALAMIVGSMEKDALRAQHRAEESEDKERTAFNIGISKALTLYAGFLSQLGEGMVYLANEAEAEEPAPVGTAN